MDWTVYGYCALGIAISIVLPILLQVLAILKDIQSTPFSSAMSVQQAPRGIVVHPEVVQPEAAVHHLQHEERQCH